MDFYEEMSQVLARDGARRGTRCSNEVWQTFAGNIEKPVCAPVVPAAPPAPEVQAVPEPVERMIAAAHIEVEAPAVVQTPPCCKEIPGDWAGLRAMTLNCRNCHLAASRQNVVFGEGNENARLMFIGEGPGADEDATGRPFVGAAGQLLDKMIAAMHLAREDVYIANVVKCRPPGNRVPGEEEAAACMGYLERQIELIKPEVIVLLGGTALHFLLKIDGISRLRGRWHEYKNIAVMPTFHPAFLLRKPEAKREAWHDLKLVMAKLGIPV